MRTRIRVLWNNIISIPVSLPKWFGYLIFLYFLLVLLLMYFSFLLKFFKEITFLSITRLASWKVLSTSVDSKYPRASGKETQIDTKSETKASIFWELRLWDMYVLLLPVDDMSVFFLHPLPPQSEISNVPHFKCSWENCFSLNAQMNKNIFKWVVRVSATTTPIKLSGFGSAENPPIMHIHGLSSRNLFS